MMKLVLLLALIFTISCVHGANQFTVDLSNGHGWNHYWEECVGSGHALLGLREDWRSHLSQVHNELGFRSVRFHGLFDDDMSVILQNGGELANKRVYSWFNVDQVYDFLVSIGMKPYVELSFMPELIASGNTTIMHYKANTSPPTNWDDWYNLIVEFEKHIVERYGLDEVSNWYQECWNEPNCGFWSGNLTQYYQLFNVTSSAVKSVSKSLKVGGPVTCQSQYLSEFIQYCKSNNVAYDFIATHEYPTDPNIPLQTGNLRIITQKSRDIVGNNTYLAYSEYNDGLFYYPSYHDTPYAAAFIIHNAALMEGIVDLFSWWTFSDIFEEPGQYSQPFFKNEGWGLLNIYQIPKPSYRAFQLLHQTGDRRFQVIDGNGNADTLFALATNSKKQFTYHIFVVNYNIPNKTLSDQTFTLYVNDSSNALPPNPKATITRIDDSNSNAPGQWLKMGSPMYPNRKQIQQLVSFSELTTQPISFTTSQNNLLTFSNVQIPQQAVVMITISP